MGTILIKRETGDLSGYPNVLQRQQTLLGFCIRGDREQFWRIPMALTVPGG